MISKLKIITLALATVLAVALLVATPFVRSSVADSGMGPLTGAWRMTSLEAATDGILSPVPYSGQIVFTANGTMSVQAMNPDTSAPDTQYTVNGYEAFYGTVSTNQADRTFVVKVESSLAPDLVGQELTRNFEVKGGTLILTPSNPAEGWRVTYERI